MNHTICNPLNFEIIPVDGLHSPLRSILEEEKLQDHSKNSSIHLLLASLYGCLTKGGVQCRLVGHGTLGVAQMFAFVHAETASAATESVSLRSEFPSVALLAEQLSTMLCRVRAVYSLVAEAALEAGLVPFLAGGQHFLRGVDRFAAFRAFGFLF